MRLKQIKNDLWQVSALIDGGLGDHQPIPISIKFRLHVEDSVEFIRSYAWGCLVPEEESWMLRSWLEENEAEILDLIGLGTQ